MTEEEIPEGVIYLPGGSGRSYLMGGMQSVFKADGEETADTYSISEWWLDAHQSGPGVSFSRGKRRHLLRAGRDRYLSRRSQENRGD